MSRASRGRSSRYLSLDRKQDSEKNLVEKVEQDQFHRLQSFDLDEVQQMIND